MRGRGAVRRAGKRLLYIAAGASLLLSVLCFVQLRSLTGRLETQKAAERWRGQSEMRFAQVSVFQPVDQPATQEDIFRFRQTMQQAFIDASLEAPENGSLYDDSYYGTQTVTTVTDRAKVEVRAYGVGGDYFLFHPLRLLSGSYISDGDFMSDRVVLDEELAWGLFGSSDIVGQIVYIGERQYPVAGVVEREHDFSSLAASPDGGTLYMSFDALTGINKDAAVSGYEAVMPNPVKSFAKNLLTEKFTPQGGAVVENSARWSLGSLLSVIGSFGKRSMNTQGVVFPYWENAARLREDYAGLALLLTALFALLPLVTAVWLAIHWGKRGFKRLRKKVTKEIEHAVEEEKEKNYVRTGI